MCKYSTKKSSSILTQSSFLLIWGIAEPILYPHDVVTIVLFTSQWGKDKNIYSFYLKSENVEDRSSVVLWTSKHGGKHWNFKTKFQPCSPWAAFYCVFGARKRSFYAFRAPVINTGCTGILTLTTALIILLYFNYYSNTLSIHIVNHPKKTWAWEMAGML